jgi:hypothetical protein
LPPQGEALVQIAPLATVAHAPEPLHEPVRQSPVTSAQAPSGSVPLVWFQHVPWWPLTLHALQPPLQLELQQ